MSSITDDQIHLAITKTYRGAEYNAISAAIRGGQYPTYGQVSTLLHDVVAPKTNDLSSLRHSLELVKIILAAGYKPDHPQIEILMAQDSQDANEALEAAALTGFDFTSSQLDAIFGRTSRGFQALQEKIVDGLIENNSEEALAKLGRIQGTTSYLFDSVQIDDLLGSGTLKSLMIIDAFVDKGNLLNSAQEAKFKSRLDTIERQGAPAQHDCAAPERTANAPSDIELSWSKAFRMMTVRIPSQSTSRFNDYSIDQYLDLWPTLTDRSTVEHGIQFESRKQQLYWGDGRMYARWPERFGDHGDLANTFAKDLHALLNHYHCKEIIKAMLGIEFPDLEALKNVNLPLSLLPVIRVNFVTEMIVDPSTRIQRSNRYPHLDSVVKVLPYFDPLRGSISDNGDTEFTYDNVPLSNYGIGDEGCLTLYDPRASKHYGPRFFEGDRHTLLFEHVRTRYTIESLRAFAQCRGLEVEPACHRLSSGLIVPTDHDPMGELYDEVSAGYERFHLRGILDAILFERNIASEWLQDLRHGVTLLNMTERGLGLPVIVR